MAEQEVLFEVKGPVATITLNRPNQGNALTPDMLNRVIDLFKRANDDEPLVRCIVLTGKGKFFCTGMDLRKASATARTKPHLGFDTIWASKKPVVLAMNGPALGGGVGIMFCTDYRVITTDCFIQFPEVQLGIYPALISGYIAPQMGPYLTQQLMMTGEKFQAADLLASRLVAQVVDPEKLEEGVQKGLQLLLRNSPAAQAGVKRLVKLVNYGADQHEDVMSELQSEFQAMMRSKEAAYGRKIFGETRRPPDWNAYYEELAKKQPNIASKL